MLKETSGDTPLNPIAQGGNPWHKEGLGIYVHVPFCKKKCPYCHFFVLPDSPDAQIAYHAALLEELYLYRQQLGEFPIRTLYLGGGTPSRYEGISDFLDELNPPSDIEITLEANPEDITLDKMEHFRMLGINRVSIGIQSLVDSELHMLGREHSRVRAIDAVWETYAAGITNISIDLMYELPFQTEETFERTLNTTQKLPITHLSFYNLTFEKNTLFTKRKKELAPFVPKPRAATRMLNSAVSTFETMGLNRYEISAFAKPGYEAIHNTGYWKGVPFLGLGPSAFSYLNGARFQNVSNLRKYIEAIEKGTLAVDFYEKLPHEDSLAERLAINLRLFQGVNMGEFPPLPSPLQERVAALETEGYLHTQENRLMLTHKGRLFYDNVGAALI